MVKSDALVAEFPATVTVIFPVVAPDGTDVVIEVAVLAVTIAVVPLKATILLAGVVLKFAPLIITDVLPVPLVGVKFVIIGIKGAPTKASPVIVHARVMSKEVLNTCPVVV